MNIMVDLETLGTKPNSAILSIGAVAFDDQGLHDEFYCNVDLISSIACGYEIDADTVYWWLSQSSEAGKILSNNKSSINKSLWSLESFIKEIQPVEMWANSPAFDLVMLRNAFNKHHVDAPWGFWIERDFRTFLSMTNADRVKPEVAHDALSDAKAQAQTLINYWNRR